MYWLLLCCQDGCRFVWYGMCLKAVCLLLMMSLCDRGDILRLYVMTIVFIFLTSCIIKHFWIGTSVKGHLCGYTLVLWTNINMYYALNQCEQRTCFFVVFFSSNFPLQFLILTWSTQFPTTDFTRFAVRVWTYHLYITMIFNFPTKELC